MLLSTFVSTFRNVARTQNGIKGGTPDAAVRASHRRRRTRPQYWGECSEIDQAASDGQITRVRSLYWLVFTHAYQGVLRLLQVFIVPWFQHIASQWNSPWFGSVIGRGMGRVTPDE